MNGLACRWARNALAVTILGLCAVASAAQEPEDAQAVPYLPSASDALGRPTITLSATVSNTGDRESTATTLRFYRSTNQTIETTDTSVGSVAVGALAASGGSGTKTLSLTAPSTGGTYYYGACVDAVAGESDTTDNCTQSITVTVDGPAPDLVVLTPNAGEVREDGTF